MKEKTQKYFLLNPEFQHVFLSEMSENENLFFRFVKKDTKKNHKIFFGLELFQLKTVSARERELKRFSAIYDRSAVRRMTN